MGSIYNTLHGLGDTTSHVIASGVSTAGATVGAAAGAGLLTTIGITSAAVPFIGPIVAGITLLVVGLGIGNGCGGTCTEATQVVNQAAPLLLQNLQAAQQTVQQNGCLTQDEAQQLENNFNTIWGQVKQQCGQIPAPGGTQCISDRQPGGKYDWTSYYLTPIQQMPVCPGTSSGAVTSVSSAGLSGLFSSPILPIALIAAALLFGGSSK